MTNIPDYYAVLHVLPQASQQEISRAYRGLMRSHHPDVDREHAAGSGAAGNDASGSNAQDELLLIMKAYGVLRDPARRAAYDRQRTAHPKGSGLPEGQRTRQATTARPVPVRKVRHEAPDTIRVTPVRWESGPWA
ncbi:J domain-containing protein [Arthrobacter sp. BHU FT2]|nr:J domain-containing protein [Arthrobacter sp. BHU FT2]